MASYMHGAVTTDELMVVVGGLGASGDSVSQLTVYQYHCRHWIDLTHLTHGQSVTHSHT